MKWSMPLWAGWRRKGSGLFVGAMAPCVVNYGSDFRRGEEREESYGDAWRLRGFSGWRTAWYAGSIIRSSCHRAPALVCLLAPCMLIGAAWSAQSGMPLLGQIFG